MLQHEHHGGPPPSPVLDTLLDRIDDIRFLGAGSANPHWLVTAHGKTYVWRQFGPDAASPGADHAREGKILAAIAGRTWAPVVLAHCPGHGMLFRASAGRHPNPDELTRHQRTTLLAALAECWATGIDDTPRNYIDLVMRYADRAHASPQRDELVDALIDACAPWPTTSFRLTHHDIHPGNLLLAGDQWTLIDWEYAALGNPWFDAVSADAMLTLTPSEKRMLAPHLDDGFDPARWHSTSRWRQRLNQLWWLARTPPDGRQQPPPPHAGLA